jgi:2-keto-4-pentenoate hydratase/2-oxohepta-3-ene-1,7-dioic acid hydratase in catechol pathway
VDHDVNGERMETGNAQTMIFGVAEMCQKVIAWQRTGGGPSNGL